jgi:hypothetical protein
VTKKRLVSKWRTTSLRHLMSTPRLVSLTHWSYRCKVSRQSTVMECKSPVIASMVTATSRSTE